MGDIERKTWPEKVWLDGQDYRAFGASELRPLVGTPDGGSVEVVLAERLRGAVDEERIARALAECIVGVTVRRDDQPVVVSRVHRDLAAYIVGGQSKVDPGTETRQ